MPSAARRADTVFRAIAHRGRRRLLTRLRDRGGMTLNDLCAGLAVSRQAVSQHLGILEAAGVVVTRWRGREKLHFLNPTPLAEAYEEWLAPLMTPESRALVQLRDSLERRRRLGPALATPATRRAR